LSVEQYVAIALQILATACEYHTVSNLFGVARCTVRVVVHETCKTIVTKLMALYISSPTGEQLQEVVQGFKDNNVEAPLPTIDSPNIPVTPPTMNYQKLWLTIIICLETSVNWPRSVHDARAFANSLIYLKVRNKELLQGDSLWFGN